jgi:phosphatidylserine/phosphatidylglycerophosphate/cardiolipin synthase-like enzyme
MVDGAEYFADLYQALQTARTRVTIAGWCVTPLMPLLRGEGEAQSILADVLEAVSRRADVYVLLWSGAPVLFEPTTHLCTELRSSLLRRAPRVHCALDDRAVFSHDHHQKAITIDGRIAYVGGMDLTTYAGDRWDARNHPIRFGSSWHDVQMRIEGEIVRDVEENFCQRWNAVTGDRLEPLPPAEIDPAWTAPAQIVRTVPEGFYAFAPEGVYGIRHAMLAAIRRAERFVYLENQYIWAPEIVEELIEAMKRRRSSHFRVVIVLPEHAELGRYDNDEHVRALSEADAGRGSFQAYTLYTAGPAAGPLGYRYLPIYVHAKVCIVDDEWFTVGSANLNRRGLATDTEMNVQAVAPDVARSLRVSLWSEHLGKPEADVAEFDPIRLIDTHWKQAADTLARRLRTGDRPSEGHVLVYEPGSSASRLLDWIQSVTLEH